MFHVLTAAALLIAAAAVFPPPARQLPALFTWLAALLVGLAGWGALAAALTALTLVPAIFALALGAAVLIWASRVPEYTWERFEREIYLEGERQRQAR